MNLPSRRAYWIMALLTMGLMLVVYGPVLWHPNSYLLSSAGDGVRGFYALSYYIRYDQGVHFSGMNYPNGEHINYNDMQPLVSYTLGWISRHIISFDEHIIGVLNLVSFASIAAAPFVLLAICRRLGLPTWYSIPVALIIAFMSPQQLRLDSHASLAHPAVLPLMWYWLIRSMEEPRRKRWYVAYGLTILLAGLLHPYFLLMGAIILLAFGAVFLLQHWREWRRHTFWFLGLLTAALSPMLVYRVWLWLTDPVPDRPENPFGLLVYIANFASVFLPVVSPMREAWRLVLPGPEPASWEGYSYVGLLGLLVLVLSLVRIIKYLIRRNVGLVLRPALPEGLRAFLWSSVLLLLWAMALPLRAPGGEWLLQWLGPLKQLRSLGRFAWYFYYVYTVFAAYYFYQLYRYLRQHRARAFAGSFLLFIGLVAAGEAWLNWRAQAQPLRDRANAADFQEPKGNYTQLLATTWRTPGSFQAILPLPYAIFGTDKLDFGAPDRARYEGFRASLDTGLPLLSSAMARTSVGQTLRLVQILGGELVDKPLLRSLPSDKPILLMVTPDELAPFEQSIIARARKLVETPRVTLYELPVAALAASRIQEARAYFHANRATLTPQPGGLYTSTPRRALLESYTQQPSSRYFLRPGALTSPKGFVDLYNGPLPVATDTGRYEISVWVNARTDYGVGHMQAKLFAPDGQQLEHVVYDTRRTTEISGDWLRASLTVHVTQPNTRLQVLYENDDLVADELLIRPVDTDVYYTVGTGANQQVVKNGYPLGTH